MKFTAVAAFVVVMLCGSCTDLPLDESPRKAVINDANITIDPLPILPGAWDVAADAISDGGDMGGQIILRVGNTFNSVAVVWRKNLELTIVSQSHAAVTAMSQTTAVGQLSLNGDGRAFSFTVSGGIRVLGTLASAGTGYNDLPLGVNNKGDAVGVAAPSGSGGNVQESVVWHHDGSVEIIHGLRDATAINDRGQVVGYTMVADSHPTICAGWCMQQRGAIWTSRDGVKVLPVPNEAYASEAFRINNRGDVLGRLYYVDGSTTIGLWRVGDTFVEIPLPGDVNGNLRAEGINDHGWVVGFDNSTGKSFVWTEGRPIIWLPYIDGDSYGVARGINNRGEIVGRSGETPVRWTVSHK